MTISTPNNTSSGEQETDSILRGTVQRITYQNKENGYCVLQVLSEESSLELPVVGYCPEVQIGIEIVARGQYVEHPKFGRQLKAEAITVTLPSSIEGIERYLASGALPGIGPKTATKLIDHFGTKTIEVLTKSPKKVEQVPGIGKKTAQKILSALSEQGELQKVMRFLIEHRLSSALAGRIYKKFENKSIELLHRDPYLLSREMKGVGFATADSIAINLGFEVSSPKRLKAGLHYALEKARDDGHCYLEREVLFGRTISLLGVDMEYQLEPHLKELVAEGYLVEDGDKIYLQPLFNAEEFVAEFISARCEQRSEALIAKDDILRSLHSVEQGQSITLSSDQRQAVIDATQYPLLLITGGPGCGKTTVIQAIVQTFIEAGLNVALAAPTGRAAQRMSQVSQQSAKTIHRLLRYDPIKQGFLHGINQPLEAQGKPLDCLIIDETSMMDIQLAKDLFSAVSIKTTLILVGDKDQLPSVGPGRVFADLLLTPHVQKVELRQLYRRDQDSMINTVSHEVNQGVFPSIPEPDGKTRSDAYFIERDQADDAARTVEMLVSDQIPKKFGIESVDITVLTPTNRGPLGTVALNTRLQGVLNPRVVSTEDTLELHHQKICVGDKVCQRVNNYQIDEYGVFNGDMGTVTSINSKDKSLVVELWDGRLIQYSSSETGQLTLAYAMTVHRSQGAEMPCVVMALHESQYTLLERQLIYTGMTRAKQLLVVVSSKKALQIATRRTQASKRCTALEERILQTIEPGGRHYIADR